MLAVREEAERVLATVLNVNALRPTGLTVDAVSLWRLTRLAEVAAQALFPRPR